jgi:hypothetical protein
MTRLGACRCCPLLRRRDRELPSRDWHKVTRHFRDGHVEQWWAAELTFLGYGRGKPVRANCATTNRGTLPEVWTWYLTTNLPLEAAPLVEVMRLYGLRHWVEQGYKQMNDTLGWTDFMVHSDRAIRRHWVLVCCAFAFCWWQQARLYNWDSPPVRKKAKPSVRQCDVAGPACCARCEHG